MPKTSLVDEVLDKLNKNRCFTPKEPTEVLLPFNTFLKLKAEFEDKCGIPKEMTGWQREIRFVGLEVKINDRPFVEFN